MIFGATGGVMDAALRTRLLSWSPARNPDPDAFTAVRGRKRWKEAVFTIPGAGEIRVAVVSGLGNTRKLMEAAATAGRSAYDFVEVMACPGGCAGGGGQPIHDGEELAGAAGQCPVGAGRQTAPIRFSHENPEIRTLYQEFLERAAGKEVPPPAPHGPYGLGGCWRKPDGRTSLSLAIYIDFIPKNQMKCRK